MDDYEHGKTAFWIVILVAILLAPAAASAQYVDRDDNVRFDEEFDENEFLVNARARAIAVPGFMLDIWFDEHANHWQDGQINMAYGGEFVWRKVGQYEVSAALEYADLSMPEQFWLDKGDPPNEAEYTEVDLKLVSLVISGYWYWDVKKWFSPYVGGGVGAGLVLGDIVKYQPEQGSSCESGLGGNQGFAPDSCFGSDGQPDPAAFEDPEVESAVPPVVPVVNLTGGARFNIGEHGVVRLEAGFYDYVFVGLSAGAQW